MKTIHLTLAALSVSLGLSACAISPYYYDDYGEEYVVEEEVYWDLSPYYDDSGYPNVETLVRVDFERLTSNHPGTANDIDLSLDLPYGDTLSSFHDGSYECGHDGNDLGQTAFGREEIHCFNPPSGRYGILVRNRGLEDSRVTLRIEVRDPYDHFLIQNYVSEITLSAGEKIALPVEF